MTVVQLDTHRAAKIGGSEAAAACGVDPFRSRLMLWWEKVNRVARYETEAMMLGTLLQGRIAEIAVMHGYEVLPAPAEGFTHRAEDWMICHPDGFTSLDDLMAVVEIKTRGTGWSSDDEHELFPYIMQLQHGMAVTACAAGVLLVLHGGHGGLRLETRVVERDDALIEQMMTLEHEIVEAVRVASPPEPRGAKSDSDAIKAMHPASDGSTIRLNKATMELVKEARGLHEQRDVIDRQYKEHVQKIQLAMGDAEHAISPFDTPAARWPTVNATRLDTSALKAARPDVYSEFAVSKPTRRFTLEN